jgi:hypothetical protein
LKISTSNRLRSVNRIPTLPRRRISRLNTILHRTTLPAAAATVLDRILAAAVTVTVAAIVAATVVAADVGDAVAVADAIAADALRVGLAEAATCPRQNMLLHKVAVSLAVMTIVVASHVPMTTAVRKLRVLRRLR